MRTILRTLIPVLVICYAGILYAEGPSITVYSSADPRTFDPQQFISQQRIGQNRNFVWQVPGFGVIRDVREINLTKGVNEIALTDVAQFIDPTTVSLSATNNGGAIKVLEQNFKFDLVSSEKLLEKYLDQEIEASIYHGDREEVVKGKLLSALNGKLILDTASGTRILNDAASYRLGRLDDGIITKPTLVWKVLSETAGKQTLKTAYQTNGITWRADYNLVLADDQKSAELNAWVTLMNLSGAEYKNASLKLIAGDVNRIQPRPVHRQAFMAESVMAADAAQGFTEKEFFEYHLYTLPRKVDVANNATQQITLFSPVSGIAVEKLLVYSGLLDQPYWQYAATPFTDRNFGTQSNSKVEVYLRFGNDKENKLGIPLPAGKVRAYKEDQADKSLEFIGEDSIDHTPKDEKVLIKIGKSFDVVGERRQTNYTLDAAAKKITESFEIILRNHKDHDQPVMIKESLYRWLNWKVTQKSDEYIKIDSRTVHFEVSVPANGKKTVTYTAEYSWK